MKRVFPNIYVPNNVKPTLVIRIVSDIFGISKAGLLIKGVRSCVDARQSACLLLRKSGRSLQETADFFSIKSEAVCYAQRVVPNKYESDKQFAYRFDMALAMLKGGSLELDIEEAKKLAMKTDYACFANEEKGNEINTADAGAFFLEGYNCALRGLKLG
ncbi:hypothetical protein BZG01_00070 [Labilibaculum manganireducens]|uniref:Chromosomal replication initiator DnaA C-terminal domain-containing protein n=1 Tax=Labilibaculum manganireducens TaxID=1940525 RepID=A0A2N3IGH0_9BACT|nr:hypothetical protein [Labilibaculum manganireducens]PKQ69368.1 hypothetical protein BZG01_00070 [Labilibaculum manganireducens]